MSPSPAMPPSASTIPGLLAEITNTNPQGLALVAGNTHWTYAELAAQVGMIARGLSRLGVRADDVVALLAPNCAEWIAASLAALSCGARVDAFNTWVRAYDLENLLNRSRASVLVIAAQYRDRDLLAELEMVLPEAWMAPPGEWHSRKFDGLRRVVVIGAAGPLGADSWADLASFPQEPKTGDEAPVAAFENRSSQAAFVVYTSGSANLPKAVPLVHRDLIENGFHIGERMGLSSVDRVWLGSPLFWSYGCANALMATMTHGGCLLIQEHFDPESAITLMERERATAVYLLPTMISAFADAKGGTVAQRLRGLASLRTGLTIGRPEEVRVAAEGFGIAEICNIYGSTETYGNCCVTDHRWPLERRLHSQGRPLPGVELRIVDAVSGANLPPGTAGEIQVRGRITPGYLNDQALNENSFTADGWYRTGDQGVVDDEGALTFVSRLSDMIKTAGINVSPAEVESFLSSHPDIAEVTVVGAPHPARGEVVVAFVVSKSGALSAGEVIAYCKDRIAGYKVPWSVSIVEELPRTTTGKLVRKALIEAATDAVTRRIGPGPRDVSS